MWRAARVAVLSALLLAGCQAQADYEEEVDETHVKVLTDANFEEALAAKEFTLVRPQRLVVLAACPAGNESKKLTQTLMYAGGVLCAGKHLLIHFACLVPAQRLV